MTFPSIADVIFLPAYATVLAGIAMLMWRRAGGDGTSLLDAAIVATGVGGLSWVFLIRPYQDDPTISGVNTLLSVSYPVIDLLLVGAIMLVAFRPSAGSPAYRLPCGGLVATLVSDTVYGIEILKGGFSFGDPYFAGWLVFYMR